MMENFTSGLQIKDLFRESSILDPNIPEDDIAQHIIRHKDEWNAKDIFDRVSLITSQLLELKDESALGEMLKIAMKYFRTHGFDMEYDDIEYSKYDKVIDLPIIKAISLLAYYSGSDLKSDVDQLYRIIIRAMNTLALEIDKYLPTDDEDGDTLSLSFIQWLKIVWDVGICLAGSIRTRARLIGGNQDGLMEVNVIQAKHYREYVTQALEKSKQGESICIRAVYVLTRPEIPPFVRPLQLLRRLEDLNLDKFHIGCTKERCERDFDAVGTDPHSYHVPECPQDCGLRIPPRESIGDFDSILQRAQMPAVNIDYDKTNEWWHPAGRDTMAISHVWRDGIGGTRDEGLNRCLHKHFSKLAGKNNCKSYWIDTATFPKERTQRSQMIGRINSTFANSNFALCLDKRLEQVHEFPDTGTALLAVTVSFWHRRAWTLLEGNKSYRQLFSRDPTPLEPFDLQEAARDVLRDDARYPLWLLSSIAELEAYMVEGMTPESSGILLSSRVASRKGDAEVIWNLLAQPYTTREVSRAMNKNPFEFVDRVDAAFISSNAQRSNDPGLCWMPNETVATAWATTAIGGVKAKIVRVTETRLNGKWFAADGDKIRIDMINWDSPIINRDLANNLKGKLQQEMYAFKLLCPIPAIGAKREKCKRVIIVTGLRYPDNWDEKFLPDTTWHWESIVELQEDMEFTEADIELLTVGFDGVVTQPASSIIPNGEVISAVSATYGTSINLDRPGAPQRAWSFGGDFLTRIPAALAWVVTLSLLTRKVNAAGAAASSNTSSNGTLQLQYWFPMPSAPTIITEWAALIPLTVYLSSFRSDFELAGEVALRGRLPVGLVPKLWALGGIAKLLREGEVFFDMASAAGDPLQVYDVQWGSVFPCYNSAAAAAVAAAAFNGKEDSPEITQDDLRAWILHRKVEMLERFKGGGKDGGSKETANDVYCGSNIEGLVRRKQLYARRQLLNVIVVSAVEENTTRRWAVNSKRRSAWLIVQLGFTLGLIAVLIGVGCIGSAVLLAIGGISRCCAQNTNLKRSPLYLRNREVHEGCMLVAAHENATIWTLYLGHRGLIDSLLNKPMIDPGKTHPLILAWFRFAEVLQVVAMTYVAGQKGWDGIVLFLLVILVWSFSTFYGYDKHASRWLAEEGFKTLAFGCEFPGRTELLGAAQLLSTEKKTYWMDGIIAPVTRRDVWLKKIGAIDSDPQELEDLFLSLGSHDRAWVNATGMQTIAGAELIRKKLREKSGGEGLRALAGNSG